MKENQAPTAVVAAEASATAITPRAQCAGDLGQKGLSRTVADLLVECLEKEGVRYVFGVPGEEIEDLLFALAASSIAFVPCRHEQGAAFIAEVWGRLTGKAGVCLATLGPGATNLLTGVADANFDKAPLVAIAGRAGWIACITRAISVSTWFACLNP